MVPNSARIMVALSVVSMWSTAYTPSISVSFNRGGTLANLVKVSGFKKRMKGGKSEE